MALLDTINNSLYGGTSSTPTLKKKSLVTPEKTNFISSLAKAIGGAVSTPLPKSTQPTMISKAFGDPNTGIIGQINNTVAGITSPKSQYVASQSPIYPTPNGGPITSNPGATPVKSPTITPAVKSTSLSTPAAKEFINSQISAPTDFRQPVDNSPKLPVTPAGDPSGSISEVPTPAPAPSATETAFAEYIKSLQPNADVTNAKTAYNDYVANQSKSVSGLEGQGRGIPLQIVRGEQEKLLKQTQPEATRLQNNIGIAQDSATAIQNANKVKYDYESGKDKPVEVGGVLYQKQADGTYKPLTSTTKTADGFTLSPGQSRYDAQGNLLANGGEESDTILTPTEAQALGVPYGTTRTEAFGTTPQKTPTEAQSKAGLFAQRTDDANQILTSLESAITKMNPVSFSAQTSLENTSVGNTLVSDEIRQTRQAERNFLNSILRRESGAVISPSEFSNGAKQYFPRPGDDTQTLQQKARNREVAISALKNEAGNSYTAVNNSLGGESTFAEEW